MNELVNFTFENKTCRTVEIDNQPWWVGKDVCNILGYKDTAKAIKQHCKGGAKYHPLSTRGGKQNARIINEPDLYRLIGGSTLPAAQRFEAWIYEEVLPQIRKTGAYISAGSVMVKTNEFSEMENLLLRAEKSLKFLTYESERLSRENRMLRENKNLREQLAKKNTKLSEAEKTQIKELGKTMTVAQIVQVTQRSRSTIHRVLAKTGGRK